MAGLAVDLLLDPFGAHWEEVSDAAIAAADVGIDGIWLWDHLAGSAHGEDRVLECWTTLTAIAATVPRVVIGPNVLNVANRRPGVLAVMAATLQEVSAGRLMLGIGAGGGRGLPYPAEQQALGYATPGDPVRRRQVIEAIHVLRQIWTGAAEPYAGEFYPLDRATGFLRPEPPPPIVVGAFGPKMAALAGEHADGVNMHAASSQLETLLAIARQAHARAGGDPDRFLVTVNSALSPATFSDAQREEYERLGVDRVIMLSRPPYDLRALRGLR
ncbi:MAG: LLM class flavin-dependent oxidoreductase [Actinobacteria bacterium]|nr:LLM class flavin-dependent oxidoreductase [Actinomycetota bacterium]